MYVPEYILIQYEYMEQSIDFDDTGLLVRTWVHPKYTMYCMYVYMYIHATYPHLIGVQQATISFSALGDLGVTETAKRINGIGSTGHRIATGTAPAHSVSRHHG